jgi:hypothetical protein
MIDVKKLEQKLKDAGISEDDMWEVCQALDPLMVLIKKYDKQYLAKIVTVIFDLLKE